jgi:hypothetical protein
MYVVTILTPSNNNPKKMVKTYYVGQLKYQGLLVNDWDEDVKFARKFTLKIDALKTRSYLRTIKGSEYAKVESFGTFSKN